MNRMLRLMILLHAVAALTTCVHAMPSVLNQSRTVHEDQDSSMSLTNPFLVKNALADTTNLTIPTIDLPELNTSSNTGAIVHCHRNPLPPAPPRFGHVAILECGVLILGLLGDERADLPVAQWSSVYPFKLPYIVGPSPYCRIRVNAVNAGSLDYFQTIMLAQRAALVVNRCTANNGGIVSLGPREEFRVEVFSTVLRTTA